VHAASAAGEGAHAVECACDGATHQAGDAGDELLVVMPEGVDGGVAEALLAHLLLKRREVSLRLPHDCCCSDSA